MAAHADGNLWEATAVEQFEADGLHDDVDADVAIVGGGFTGCSAALHAATAGARVLLLEGRSIGYGASGRNVGLVNAGLWMAPDAVERSLGPTAGRRLNAALAGGPEYVFSLIEKYAIACEPVQRGTLHCAHSAAGLEDLRERLRQQRARDAPVELLSDTETARAIGNDRYRGALLDKRAGTIQPLAYCRGLARAANAAGATIYEHTRAMQLERVGARWRVRTTGGSVTAETLLICTNAYHEGLTAESAPRYTLTHYFQLATTPLDTSAAASILPERHGCWDTALVMSSFRLDRSNRLLIGGIGSLKGAAAAAHRGWARRKLAELFPQARDAPFEYAWHGRIALTRDFLPKLVSIGPRALCIYGYNGRGIAPGTIFGRAAAEFALSDSPDALPIPLVSMPQERLRNVLASIYELGAAAWHLTGLRGWL